MWSNLSHHEALVAEELDQSIPVGFPGRADHEARGRYVSRIRPSHTTSARGLVDYREHDLASGVLAFLDPVGLGRFGQWQDVADDRPQGAVGQQ
jgi:hypothetical protein